MEGNAHTKQRDTVCGYSPWEFPLEARVVLHGLQHSPLNGQRGTVVSLMKNYVTGYHTTTYAVKANNGRQQVKLDGSEKVVLVRPSNLLYEPRMTETLEEEECRIILRHVTGHVPTGELGKNYLQERVMTCLRPVADKYRFDEQQMAHEVGGLLAEALAVEQLNQLFEEFRSARFIKNVLNFKTVSIPADKDDDPQLEWLGGLGLLPDGMSKNDIPHETVFARLSRPGKMPQSSFLTNQAAVLLEDNAEGLANFHDFCSGSLTFVFDENAEDKQLRLMVKSTRDLVSNPISTNIVVFYFLQSYDDGIGGYLPQMMHGWNVDGVTNVTLVHELRLHLLHRFFRALAMHLTPKCRVDIYNLLKEMYHGEKKWELMVDLSFAMADARFICHDNNTALGLLDVGEALEAMGLHGKAALVYKDLALLTEKGMITNEDSVIGPHKPHEFAGVAFYRAGKYETALQEYLLSLKVILRETSGGGSCHVNHQYTSELLHKVHLNYRGMIALAYEKGESQSGDDDDQKLMLSHNAFVRLLNACGDIPPCHSTDKTFEATKAQPQLLRPEYTTSLEVAWEALVRAINDCSSGPHFNSILRGFLFVDETNVRFLFNEHVYSLPKKKDSKKQARNEMEARYKQKLHNGVRGCDNPACMRCVEKVFDCPCKGAVYCSKECQSNHWNEHKAIHKALMKLKSKK